MEIKYCNKCLFPETKPDLYFNEESTCSACIAAESKDNGIDWQQREKDFKTIIDKFKLKDNEIGYDCLIPVSGGKDSTYQAYFMKEVYGMNPLCVCFETTKVTEIGRRNLDNISKMGIDVVHFKKNYNAYKSMVKEGFLRVGASSIFHFTRYTPRDIKVAINSIGKPVRFIKEGFIPFNK